MPKLTLTDDQTATVLNSLYDYELECARYERSSRVEATPGPQETCCEYHLSIYERDQKIHASLKARLKDAKKLIKIFEGKK